MPHSTNLSSSSLKAAFDRDGFVIIPSTLSPTELSTLRTACAKATDLARGGHWPYIRTLPRQFPPWKHEDAGQGIWGVQHLMHPELPGHETFTKTYFGDEIVEVVRSLLGECGEEELVMELWNLLVRPDGAFELRWHRDDVSVPFPCFLEAALIVRSGRYRLRLQQKKNSPVSTSPLSTPSGISAFTTMPL